MIHISKNLEETLQIAKKFLNSIKSESNATAVAFYGDLGAGKTTFIQFLAKEMGIEEPATSPTFVIQKTYEVPLKSEENAEEKKFDKLVHIDAYRLESGGELSHLRFEETLLLPRTLVCIEWPFNVEGAIPESALKVECKFIDENTRTYEFGE
jgi:tRNA threonylcarbamoyladenosine biosynthesis protein TsaE